MNPLAKALLATELDELIYQLEKGTSSYFETARRKKRVTDIIALCDCPEENQQIFGEKSHIQPIADAEIFAQNCHYSSSFCGVFRRDNLLEKALDQQTKSSWALLFDATLGWQIWIMEYPNCTLLISDWGTLNEVYHWLLEEQQDYACLTPDEGIRLPNKAKKRFIQPISTFKCNLPNTAQPVEQAPVRLELIPDEPEHVALPTLHLDQVEFSLNELTDLSENKLYQLLPLTQIAPQHIDLLLYYIDFDDVFNRTIYLAEQINAQGHFVKYLALFGAQNELQAIRMVNAFSQSKSHKLAAIRSINWSILSGNLLKIDELFDIYAEQNNIIFQSQPYYPFIPKHLVNMQKFIKFEETYADLDTPILVLKERHKIRIIHGKNRLALSKNEKAFPYLMLDRQDGISWQIIQEKISMLEQPIQPLQLYQALQQ